MANRIFTDTLKGPIGGPFKVVHNLDSYEVEVSLGGLMMRPSADGHPEPDGFMATPCRDWVALDSNTIMVETVVELEDGGRGTLEGVGMTVIVKALRED